MEAPQGLTLELSERIELVSLPTDIDTLVHAQLHPQLHMSRSDPVHISGQLVLSGTYTPVKRTQNLSFEHTIVVSVHVPDYRLVNEADVSVTVSSLNVTVVAPRAIEVTGMLIIHGVERTDTRAMHDDPQDTPQPTAPHISSDATHEQPPATSTPTASTPTASTPTASTPDDAPLPTPVIEPIAAPTPLRATVLPQNTPVHAPESAPQSWSTVMRDAHTGTPMRFVLARPDEPIHAIASRYGLTTTQLMTHHIGETIVPGDWILLPAHASDVRG